MNKFWSGFILYGAILSLEQDMMGKEKYLKLMDLMWVDAKYTVPLAIAMVVLSVYLFTREE